MLARPEGGRLRERVGAAAAEIATRHGRAPGLAVVLVGDDPASRVYVAGEIEFETAEERTERGIPLHSSVLKGLREVGEQVGVPYDLE